MSENSKIISNIEEILKDPNSSQYDRTLALCMLEIKQKIITVERLLKLQLGLISTLIICLVTVAVYVK